MATTGRETMFLPVFFLRGCHPSAILSEGLGSESINIEPGSAGSVFPRINRL